MKNNSIWMRLGVLVSGSAQDIDNIIKGDGNLLTKLLREGKFEIDGDAYIPTPAIDEYNQENGTQHEGEEVVFCLSLSLSEVHCSTIIDEKITERLKDNYSLWQQGDAELHIASLNIYSKKDKTLLGGADNVFYSQTSALRYLVDYFIGENMDKLKDVYYVCEVRLFSPPLPERQSYPTVESLFDLSAYGEVKPYYSYTIITPEN